MNIFITFSRLINLIFENQEHDQNCDGIKRVESLDAIDSLV